MKRVGMGLFIAAVLVGCMPTGPQDPVVSVTMKEYKILDRGTGKSKWFTLNEVGTGYVLKHRWIENRCSGYVVGQNVVLAEVVSKGRTGEYVSEIREVGHNC